MSEYTGANFLKPGAKPSKKWDKPQLWWVSWVQLTEDYRPLKSPPNEGVLGWWCSGYTADDTPILCALVAGDDPKAILVKDWPEVADVRWRFEHRVESTLLSDRFPISKWMEKRIAAYESRA